MNTGKLSKPSMSLLRLALGLLLIMAGLGTGVLGQETAPSNPVYQVDIDGVINPGSAGLLEHAVATAEANAAAALVVRIDTPGGLLSSTRDMVRAIGESDVPVVGYVGPSGASATSAGAFILLSTHLAVMNAGTNVGASSPVSGGGEDIGGTMGRKVMNDSRAFMRSIANSRDRNADVAESFVSEAVSLTADEAVDKGVVNLMVSQPAELLTTIDGREVEIHGQPVRLNLGNSEITQVKPRLVDRLLAIIAHPQIAHLLLSLGMLAIYFEILSPGLAFPGVLGVIAVILGLVGVHALPVNVGFLMLLFLGMGLMVAEYFVAGFGVLGIGGAMAFILGSFNLFDGSATEEHRNTIVAISIAVSGAVLLTTFLITRSLRAGEAKGGKLVGKTGEAMVSFDKTGYVLVDDKRWLAETEEPLRHGDRITVTAADADRPLKVRKAGDEGGN